jgi:hypothetical protein
LGIIIAESKFLAFKSIFLSESQSQLNLFIFGLLESFLEIAEIFIDSASITLINLLAISP